MGPFFWTCFEEFMVLARKNKEVDRMNRWKFDNSSKAMVLNALDVPLTRLGSGFALRAKIRNDVNVVMVTHNLKAEKLANGIMTSLVRVTQEHFVLKRLDSRKKVFLERKVLTNGRQFWMQFPVTMDEAITVNKSQGMTYDVVIVITAGIPR